MDAGSPTLFVAAALGALAAIAPAAVWFLRRQTVPSDDPRARERRAKELGWQYDATAVGDTVFTIRGEGSGVKWKVRYRDRPGPPRKPARPSPGRRGACRARRPSSA